MKKFVASIFVVVAIASSISVQAETKRISKWSENKPNSRYEIRNGDSLAKIAERFHVTLKHLEKANPQIKNPRIVMPDQEVKLPTKEDMTGYEAEMLKLVNMERAKFKLKPLIGTYSNLNKSARAKSEDMSKNHYFSHQSPTFGSPFDMMRQFGVTYKSAGENISQGYETPASAIKGFMNSAGHRANILNKNFTHCGIGYAKNGKYYTQQFIQK